MRPNLYIHAGGSVVDFATLESVATPKPTDSHTPIPHSAFVCAVEETARNLGYAFDNPQFALAKDGARFFGLAHLGRNIGDSELLVGLRNSHDKSYPAALVLGQRVFVCDNLAFSGEVVVGRRHTRHIMRDLPTLLVRGFDILNLESRNIEARTEFYKATEVSDRDADALILRSAYDFGALSTRQIPRALEAWRVPPHEEFRPRTAWSLFNALTEAHKPAIKDDGTPVRADMIRLVARGQHAIRAFDRYFNFVPLERSSLVTDDVG